MYAGGKEVLESVHVRTGGSGGQNLGLLLGTYFINGNLLLFFFSISFTSFFCSLSLFS